MQLEQMQFSNETFATGIFKNDLRTVPLTMNVAKKRQLC